MLFIPSHTACCMSPFKVIVMLPAFFFILLALTGRLCTNSVCAVVQACAGIGLFRAARFICPERISSEGYLTHVTGRGLTS